jgi:hypothetical protein
MKPQRYPIMQYIRGLIDRIRTWTGNNMYAVGLAIGMALLIVAEQEFFSRWHPHWQLFLKEVAFAVFIASFFSLTIERYQREEFIKLVNREREDLKRDIFLYAYGHDLPEDIQQEISKSILSEPFYRKDYRIEWEFSLPTDGTDCLLLVKKFSFDVMNGTSQARNWKFNFTQVTAAEKKILEESELKYLRVQRGPILETLGPSDMHSATQIGEPHVRNLAKEFPVHGREQITVHYVLEERRRTSMDDVYSPSQCVAGKMLVTVRVIPPLRLDVTASSKAALLTKRPDHAPPMYYSWELLGGLLPFQGIAFSWSPMIEDPKSTPGLDQSI